MMCTHALEHAYDPITTLENISEVMAKDGYIFVTVPANNITYSTPDYFVTGYTPLGLGIMANLCRL